MERLSRAGEALAGAAQLAPLGPEHFAIRLLDKQVAERVFDIFRDELWLRALEFA